MKGHVFCYPEANIGKQMITFAAVAVGIALDGIGDKISEILAL